MDFIILGCASANRISSVPVRDDGVHIVKRSANVILAAGLTLLT